MIIVPILLAVAAAVILIAVAVSRRTNDMWQQAASTLGLAFERGHIGKRRQMRGMIGQIPVAVYTFTRRSGNNSSTYTAVEASLGDLDMGLQISREGTLHRIGKFFGFQDIEVGDPAADDIMTVKGGDEERVKAFLTPARTVAIQRFLESYRHGKISDQSVNITQSGTISDPQRLVTSVRRAVSLAEVLTRNRPAADAAIQLQKQGYLQAAADAFEAAAADPWDLDGNLTAAETLRSAGKTDASAGIMNGVKSNLPADPIVESWRTSGTRRQPDSPPINTDQEAVAAELFNPGLMSFDAMTLFEERYQGTRVTWSGTIRRVTRFTTDRDFEGAGIRAILQIAEIHHALYGMIEVDAVAAFPESAWSHLEGAEGSVIRFSGTLTRSDPLMRNLYVTGATIVE